MAAGHAKPWPTARWCHLQHGAAWAGGWYTGFSMDKERFQWLKFARESEVNQVNPDYTKAWDAMNECKIRSLYGRWFTHAVLHRLENLEMGERSSRVLDSFSMSKSMFLPRQKRAAGTLGTLLVLVRDPDCKSELGQEPQRADNWTCPENINA